MTARRAARRRKAAAGSRRATTARAADMTRDLRVLVPALGLAAGKALENLKLEGDQRVGAALIKRAIEEPMRWIATNAGEEGSIVVAKVRDMKADEGYNAATDTYEDLVKAGVIDPAKVVRNALQNASSIASLLLTTEALVSEIPEEKKEAPAMPGGGGMGGMY
jgi:chaperonin GroEL